MTGVRLEELAAIVRRGWTECAQLQLDGSSTASLQVLRALVSEVTS